MEVEAVDDDRNGPADCIVCQKQYSRKSGLYRHLREVHKVEIKFAGRKHKFKCPDPGCSVTFQMNEKIRDHITEVHGVNIEMCSKHFKSFSEFEQWKDAVQHKMKSLYVSAQTKRSPNNNRYKYYTCHRSGGYTETRSVGKRKSISKKIDGWCPSGMDTHIFSNGAVNVKFWMTHFGHEIEIDRLNLSRKEKLLIAKKVKDGLSIDKILDEIRDSLVSDDIRRIHLLSRQDIVNICQALKITNKESLIQKDNTSINSWLDSMEALGDACPVIFFKDKGADYETLKNNDFVLFVMTKVQQKLLQICENRLICLDSIITCHYFNYYLVTLLTIDDLEVGCPLAFCLTNRIDDAIITLFLSFVKSRTGPISAAVFMSADNEAYYSSWEKVMGPIDIRLLCSWNVDQNWRKNLDKIPCSDEKKLRAYKEMRLIMQEPNFEKFKPRLEEIVLQFDEDEEMKNFSSFLREKYVERSNLWAFCYRSPELIKYNAVLEQIHRDLHECYAEGRIASSVPRVLNLVLQFSRNKVLEKIEKRPRQFQTDSLSGVYQSHKDIKDIDVVKAQDVPEKQIKVPTVGKDTYHVAHNISKECPFHCEPVCVACKVCFHRFTCTCLENVVNMNICRHIHASVNLMKSQCKHSEKERRTGTTENLESVLVGGDMQVFKEEIVEIADEDDAENEDVDDPEVSVPCVPDKDGGAMDCDVVDCIDDGGSNVKADKCKEANADKCNEDSENISEHPQFIALEKVTHIYELLINKKLTTEKYKQVNEYLDKVLEIVKDTS